MGRAILPHYRRWTIPNTATLEQPASGLSEARQFAIDAANLLADTRCHNVVLLDVTGVSPVTDFLILATGTSPIQMKSACDEVQEMGEPRGFRALSRTISNGEWTCIDLVDVVVHVFNPESRAYYDLDNLWGDGRTIEWRDE
jgi:ribosome-associated protein